MDKTHYGLILSVSAAIGILVSLRFKGIFHKVISFGLGISILLAWLSNSMLSSISFYSLLVWGILTVIYGFKEKDLPPADKSGIISMGWMILISWLFKFQHWPGFTLVNKMLLIPIAIYIFALLRQKNPLKKEISFMMIWITYGILEVLRT